MNDEERHLGRRFLTGAGIAAVVFVLAMFTQRMAPPYWPSVAHAIQRGSLAVAVVSLIYGILYLIDARRTERRPRFVTRPLFIVFAIAVAITAATFFA